MRKDKDRAIQLRREGKSYREIVALTGIPKSTLFEWFHSLGWSVKLKKKLSRTERGNARARMIALTDRMREERMLLYTAYRNEAKNSFERYFRTPVFVAGLMLYWGEGDGKIENGNIRIANSDPMILRFFLGFISVYLSEIRSKVKMQLILYPDLDDIMCRKFWSRNVGVPLDKFIKTQYIEGRSSKRTLPYGVGLLYVPSKAHKHKLLEWINRARSHAQAMRV